MTKTKIIRITYVAVALVLGMGVVYGLSRAGNEAKGPVETVLSKASDAVESIESNMILEKRTEKRTDKLQWLQPYKANKAKLIAADKIIFGAYDNNAVANFQPIINLEDTLHTTLPVIHIYTAWGNKKDGAFPKEKVQAIVQLGSIPSITWEPWLSAFDGTAMPALRPAAERDKEGLKDVAAGLYDDYIRQWALQARQIKSPIILRWAHEMNDPYRYPWGPQNNSAEDFKAAYTHVHRIFDEAKVRNVLWAWSPHPNYGYFKEYYPGDSLVDYVAVGTLNYGSVANWSQWWTFDDIFGKYYKGLAQFKKPIILSEFGSLAVGGNRPKWFADALSDMPRKYPLVNMILFFHYDDDRTTTQQSLNWSFIHDRKVVAAIRPEIDSLQQH